MAMNVVTDEQKEKGYLHLADFCRKYLPKAPQSNLVVVIIRHLSEILGEHFAKFCELYTIRQDEIIFSCPDKQFRFELQLHQIDILQCLNDFLQKRGYPPFLAVDFCIRNATKNIKNTPPNAPSRFFLKKNSNVFFFSSAQKREIKLYGEPLAIHSAFLEHHSFGSNVHFYR